MTETSQLGPSFDGTVMLDIGGDIGALIIMTGESMHLAEIEISPKGAAAGNTDEVHGHDNAHDHAHDHETGSEHSHSHAAGRTHVAVRERRGPSGVRYAAIYPGLQAGLYQIWGLDGEPRDTVEIIGGEVRQIDWR